MEKRYVIDKETMETCKDLEFYDLHHHFPWEKKKVSITLSYSSIVKLKGKKNKSKYIDSLI
jgi:hypothetical protein